MLCAAAMAVGCGSDEQSDAPPPQPEPTARQADFPSAKGKALMDLKAETQQEGPVLAPSVSVLHRGENRFGFALFDTAQKQITGAQVALYTAKQDGSGLRGPFVARSESLAVKPQFQSTTTTSDPDAAKNVYVADVDFNRIGKQVVVGLARLDGRMLATSAFSVEVTRKAAAGPPEVGDKGIEVHTQTLADVGGDPGQLTTRRPPAEELLKTDLADVMGKQPVVISFATPLLCQSRVCGPIIDIVEQVRSSAPKDVAFIQQEIYEDNEVDKGVRSQVAAWKLPTEPWTYVLDRSGTVVQRFEGAFSVGELQRAVAKVSGA